MRHSLPDHIDKKHPIVRQEYAVYTPPIDAMIQKIGDWIDHQKPGGYIYGPSRFGKSRGVKWHVKSALEDRFQSKVPLITWLRVPGIHTSEAEFWHQLLIASNFAFSDIKKRFKKSEGRYLFMQRMITLARSARSNYVVLLIDEAQELTLAEWKWLVGVQNQLDFEGYRLSIFSIGSHQMGYQHDFLALTGNAHIAARFFVAHTRFHGLSAVEEVEYVLCGYDEDSEWPTGSGNSYLKYFAPEQYQIGMRLSTCATDIWESLIELLPPGWKQKHEFPMQHVAHAVESALLLLARGKDWEDVTSRESWQNLIRQTEFSDHMRMISMAS